MNAMPGQALFSDKLCSFLNQSLLNVVACVLLLSLRNAKCFMKSEHHTDREGGTNHHNYKMKPTQSLAFLQFKQTQSGQGGAASFGYELAA